MGHYASEMDPEWDRMIDRQNERERQKRREQDEVDAISPVPWAPRPARNIEREDRASQTANKC